MIQHAQANHVSPWENKKKFNIVHLFINMFNTFPQEVNIEKKLVCIYYAVYILLL